MSIVPSGNQPFRGGPDLRGDVLRDLKSFRRIVPYADQVPDHDIDHEVPGLSALGYSSHPSSGLVTLNATSSPSPGHCFTNVAYVRRSM